MVLTDTEAQMVTAAKAENKLLLDYLTGAKVVPNTPGTVTNPEYASYPIDTAVLQGGARNATSDLAFRYLYNKVRSINGPIADRGTTCTFSTSFKNGRWECRPSLLTHRTVR